MLLYIIARLCIQRVQYTLDIRYILSGGTGHILVSKMFLNRMRVTTSRASERGSQDDIGQELDTGGIEGREAAFVSRLSPFSFVCKLGSLNATTVAIEKCLSGIMEWTI